MPKNIQISFEDYQNLLLSNGLAIAARAGSGNPESLGSMISSKIIEEPDCDLITSVRTIVEDEFIDAFQMGNGFDNPDKRKRYKNFPALVSSFNTENSLRENILRPTEASPPIEWLDPNNPSSGVIGISDRNIYQLFDLRVSTEKLLSIIPELVPIFEDGEYYGGADADMGQLVQKNLVAYLETITGNTKETKKGKTRTNWENMMPVEHLLIDAYGGEAYGNSYGYKKALLSPILDSYKHYCIYLTGQDAVLYLVYPIIAGERLDGSHEITIFETIHEG